MGGNKDEFHIMQSIETAHVNEGNHLELEIMKREISAIKEKVENLYVVNKTIYLL